MMWVICRGYQQVPVECPQDAYSSGKAFSVLALRQLRECLHGVSELPHAALILSLSVLVETWPWISQDSAGVCRAGPFLGRGGRPRWAGVCGEPVKPSSPAI